MPLKVIIVGAGIAGVCAALSLRQAGHDVQIFEKSGFTGEVGAALSLTPNGSRVLSNLGFSFERARATKMLQWDTLLGDTMEQVGSVDFSKYGPCWALHRVDLHDELLRLATSKDTTNSKPVTLRLGAQVVDASADGSITLKDGSCHTADLIVAADGLHSVLRKTVLTHDTKAPSPSGLSSFRFLIDTKLLKDDAKLAPLLEARKGFALMIDAQDKVNERHIVWYPCRKWVPFKHARELLMLNQVISDEVQNFVGIHPTRKSDLEDGKTEGKIENYLQRQSWSRAQAKFIGAWSEAMKDSMLKEFGHFNPGLVQIMSQSSHVKCWPLYVYDPLPRWFNGRIILIGDAAHPMLPFGGQGGNSAIEDAGALGHLFRSVHDPAVIEKRLKLYELVRKDRVSRIQILSSVRAGREKEVGQKLRKYAEPGSAVPSTHQERTDHDFEHDVFAKCEEVLREAQLGEETIK